MATEQPWHPSNLPFNREARGSENRTGVSVFFLFCPKREVWIQIFSISFCLAIQRDGRRGGSRGGKERETNTHTHRKKKKQGTSLTYECYMQMVGREQMLLHLIDLYVNCIQTFQCVSGPAEYSFTGFRALCRRAAILSAFKHQEEDEWTETKETTSSSAVCFVSLTGGWGQRPFEEALQISGDPSYFNPLMASAQ